MIYNNNKLNNHNNNNNNNNRSHNNYLNQNTKINYILMMEQLLVDFLQEYLIKRNAK